MSKSIWILKKPDNIPLQTKQKYIVECPSCSPDRTKSGTKSLNIFRDTDNIIRWECYHPGCLWNVRHAAPDNNDGNIEDIKETVLNFALPMTVDPTKEKILQNIIKNSDAVHWYRNNEGKILFGVRRQLTKEGGKIMTPIAMLSTGDFCLSTYPKMKVLYNQEELIKYPNRSVIVVEGEKAVDLGKAKFPNSVVVTWIGGCKSVSRGDWSLLAKRTVLIWPDNDEGGKQAAEEIVDYLDGEVAIAYVNHLPHAADIADDISQADLDKAIISRIPQQGNKIDLKNTITEEAFFKGLKLNKAGVETGWDIVDQSILLRGFTIIEGRSSHGKSTVLFNLANNILHRDKNVLFYTYEMSAEEVLLRMSLLNQTETYDPIPWKNQELLVKAILEGKSKGYKDIKKYLNKNFFLISENLPFDKLIADLKQNALQDAVVFIDYIQFIPAGRDLYGKPRYLQIKQYAETLLSIAKKHNMVIVVGSQLTSGDQPAQDVAREGRDIYNASDVVLRIWNREEGEQTKTKWHKDDDSDADGLLLVRKARAGATIRQFNFNFTKTRKMDFNSPTYELKLGETL